MADPTPPAKLTLDGPTTQTELDRIVTDGKSEIAANITKDGVTAEISTTKKGWNLGAFGGWLRGKGWTGGGKIQRDL